MSEACDDFRVRTALRTRIGTHPLVGKLRSLMGSLSTYCEYLAQLARQRHAGGVSDIS